MSQYRDYFKIIEAPAQPPACAVTLSPANPISGQTLTLNISATDNTYLKNVIVHWKDASEHTNAWNNLFVPSLNQNVAIGSFAAGQQIEYWVVASDTSGNSTESIHQTVTVFEPTQYLYTVNNGTITITGYTGSGGAITIPSTINGLPVTSIG